MASRPTVEVRYRGETIAADSSRPLLLSIDRGGFPILQRSIRYHRPRAPFCGLGFCTQCLVRVNGIPNVRACRYLPRAGDRIQTENAWPSPRHDLQGLLDVVFPKGIDTVRGFRRPQFLVPLYHRVVRRLAGYGRLPDAPPTANVSPGARRVVDVLVIGAGVAGASAAAELTKLGADFLVVDRERPRARSLSIANALWDTTIVFLPPPSNGASRKFRALALTSTGPALSIEARTVILAPGSYDTALFFDGSDRPGVVPADGALRLTEGKTRPPFRRALLFGGGSRSLEMLNRFGGEVEAIAAPGTIEPGVTRRAAELDIPLYPRSVLVSAAGRTRVRSVRLLSRPDGPRFSLGVDAVILAHRRLPHSQLFFQLGATMHWEAQLGHYVPTLSASGATSVPDLFAAGSAAGFSDASSSEASGNSAAKAAMHHAIEAPPDSPRTPPEHPHELIGYYADFLRNRPALAKCVVCPCEDVLLDELEHAHVRGFRGIEVIKRYSGVGTGLCQGRYCLPDTLLLLSLWESRPPVEMGYITQRPPVLPTPLAALAGLPEEDRE